METAVRQENQLVSLINQNNLDKTKAQVLLDNFSSYFELAADWESKAKSLTVNSIEQKAEMKMAREGRLFLAQKRIDVEKTRKQLKESSLREGQTIDAIAKVLTNLILPIEEDLENKEKFAAIQEASRKALLKAERESILSPYSEFVPFGLNFGEMQEEDFNKTFEGAKLQFEAKQEAIKKAEQERIAKEKAEAEERERIRLENIKLKEEADKREKQLAIERAKAKEEADKAAKLQAEIKAKEQAELKAKQEAEAKIIEEQKAKEAEAKKMAKASDKVKLKAWLQGFELSKIQSQNLNPESIQLQNEIIEKFASFKNWANSKIESI